MSQDKRKKQEKIKQKSRRDPVAREMFEKQKSGGYHQDVKKRKKPKHKKKFFDDQFE